MSEGSDGKVKAFRFSDDELALLDVIQGHTGIRSRTEALRTVLEFYVKSKGLEPGKTSGPGTSEK